MLIGVLALQGDFREHIDLLAEIGVACKPVIRPTELHEIDGLVIPGGESTTMGKLATNFGLMDPIRSAIANGLPAFGTCAGLIMLADRLVDGAPDQQTFGGLDVTVRRNAFGAQQESFETSLKFRGIDEAVSAAFIRAPIIESVGPMAQIDSTLDDGRIVAVSQQNLMGIAFHPEMLGEKRIHAKFLELVDGHQR